MLRTPMASFTASSVLLVDDEDFFRMSLREMLGARVPGVRFFEAANGIDALRVLDEHEVDCVVTDLAMPEMDGVGLLLEMLRRRTQAPVVVVSAYAHENPNPEGTPRCEAKPVDLGRLCGHIEELLAGGPRSESSRITLSGLLQVLTWERRSCVLKSRTPSTDGLRREGSIQMAQGQVSGAYVDEIGTTNGSAARAFVGDEAIVEILCWDQATNELESVRDGAAGPECKVAAPLHQLFARAATRTKQSRITVRPPKPADDDVGTVLDCLMGPDGVLGAAVVDRVRGVPLGARGEMKLDDPARVEGTCRMVDDLSSSMRKAGAGSGVEDMVFTLDDQVHILRPVRARVLYLICDRLKMSMAGARRQMDRAERALEGREDDSPPPPPMR